MSSKEQIYWREPITKHLPEVKKALKTAFSPAAVLRIFVIAAIIITGTYILVKWYFPAFEYNWWENILLTLTFLMFLLLIAFSSLFIPCLVLWTTKGFALNQGHGFRFTQYLDISEIIIDRSYNLYPLLRVRYINGKQETVNAIHEKINIDELIVFIEKNWHKQVTIIVEQDTAN